MRFAKQKFVIFTGFLLLPLVFIFAVFQQPQVSNFVLGVALKVARLRTGLKIEAESWQVNPLSFSASFSQVALELPTLKVFAPELRLQFSPLGLFFGELSLKNLRVEKAYITGALAPEWLKRDKDSSHFDWKKIDLPSFVGQQMAQLTALLKSHRLNFDELTLSALRIDLKELRLERGNILLENLDAGQLRLDWDLENLASPAYISDLRNFAGSIALIRESKKDYYLAVRTFRMHVDPQAEPEIEAFGRVPGELQVKTNLKLEGVNAWLKRSPSLASYAFQKGLAGHLLGELQFKIPRSGERRVEGKVQWNTAQIDGYRWDGMSADFSGNFENWRLAQLRLKLPQVPGDATHWKKQILLRDVEVANNKISGEAEMNEVPLCGLLVAASVADCYLSFSTSGVFKFGGELDPLEIRVAPEFKISSGTVFSDPYPLAKGDPTLLHFRPATLSAQVAIRAKEIQIQKSELVWAEDAKVSATGKVVYLPTLVDVVAESNKLNLEKALVDFLNIEVQGKATSQTNIFYSSIIPQAEGRTRISARLSMDDAGLEGQRFGLLAGPVNYLANSLQIGPLKLRNGGGVATIDGSLSQQLYLGKKSSFLDVTGKMQRLEMDVKTLGGTQIFQGFVSGTSRIKGFTDPAKENGLSGPIEIQADTVKSFSIPFQSATAKAMYSKKILFLQSVKAKKEVGTLDLSGELRPTGGTEIRFSTDDVKIDGLGYLPKIEQRFREGLMRVDGYWRPASGWEVNGKLSQLKVGDKSIPSGKMKLSGDVKSFAMKVDLGNVIEADYRADSTGAHLRPIFLRAKVRDEGIYTGLAYLREWENPYPVQTRGSLEIEWEPRRGHIKSQNLEIRGPEGTDSKTRTLLKAEGLQELAWLDKALIRNTLGWEGATEFRVEKSLLGRALFNIKMPLALLGLFLPSSTQAISGTASAKGSVALPLTLDSLEAQGKVENATVFMRSLGQNLSSLNGDMDFRGQRMTINQTRAQLGAGEVELSGAYKIDFFQPAVSLNIRLNRGRIIILDDVPLDLTGDVSLKGEEYPFLLSGKAQVVGGSYAKEFGQQETLPTQTTTQALLKYALDVDIQPQFYVRNSLCNAPLSGRLTVTGTDLKALVKGNLELGRGSIYAKDHEFKIVQGRVNFFDSPDAYPVLNLQANTVVKQPNQNYKVDLSARGPSNDLNIEFSSDPSLPTRDIVNLLAFGVLRNANDATQVGATTSPTSSYADTVRAEALQALFGKSLGPSLYKNTGFQVKVQAAPDLSQKETVTKVTVGRKLSERMSATFGRSIDAGKNEKNLQVDYRLLKNVNITGVYESPSPQESSKGVDLRFRFDIK